jgi:hypothetical protein
MKSFRTDTSPSVHYCTSFKHGGNNLAANLCILNLVKKFGASLYAWLIPSQASTCHQLCSYGQRCVKRRWTSITMSVTSWHFSIPVPILQLFSIIHHNHPLLYTALHGISVHLCNGELFSHDFYFKIRSPTQYLCTKYGGIPICHGSPNCSPPGFIT